MAHEPGGCPVLSRRPATPVTFRSHIGRVEESQRVRASESEWRRWAARVPHSSGAPRDLICDEKRAYLFFTSLNGKLWRCWTDLNDFPRGFDHCEIALQAAIFEASHTYKLKGTGKYLSIVEQNGRRYYKAYLADSLDGQWTPLADTEVKPFAGAANIRPAAGVKPWTDNISHGELIREGVDQTMTVGPANLRFLFQGVLESEKAGKGYGQFPWRLGILTPVAAAPASGK